VTTTRLNSRRAAFFDVDKTLLPGSSLYLLARGMYRRGFYTWRDLVGFALGQITFRVTGAEGRRGMAAARESALAFVEGKSQEELVQLGHDVVVEVIGPRIYPGMRRVIDEHHANGDRTYLVTAAPRELAERMAAYLGMDGALGTEAELVDGVYTGRLIGPVLHGPAKLDAVVRLAEQEGIDLRESSAYSDSVNDRPMLEGVAHPVAVNPDRELRDLAAQRGWPVQDFRKRRRLWLFWLPMGLAASGAAAAAVAYRRAALDRAQADRTAAAAAAPQTTAGAAEPGAAAGAAMPEAAAGAAEPGAAAGPSTGRTASRPRARLFSRSA
jgi:HAD superfamily hydrolase (TIGR01490 family)